MTLAFLLACAPSASWTVAPGDLGIPVPTIDRGSPPVLWETPPGTQGAVKLHADTHGAWALPWTGAGLDDVFLPTEDAGLAVYGLPAGTTTPVTLPPPPPLVEDLPTWRNRRDDLVFLPAADGLAFALDSTLHHGTATGWTSRPYDIGLGEVLAVTTDQVVQLRIDTLHVVGADGTERVRERPPFDIEQVREIPWRLGPLDGAIAHPVWLPWGQVCSGRWDLVADTLTDTVCIDVETPMAFASTVGGTPDRALVLLEADSILRAFTVLVQVDAQGPAILGETPVLDADSLLHDDPADDRLPLLEDDDGPTAWITPDLRLVRSDDPLPAQIGLGTACDPDPNPFSDWCVSRSLEVTSFRTASGVWSLGVENNHDARTRLFAQQALPEGEPLPLTTFTGGTVLADGFEADSIDVFGVPLPEDCLTAQDPNGTSVERTADGTWLVDELTDYTVELATCDLGDGGPPLVGQTFTTLRGLFDPFELGAGYVPARGYALDVLDDPPQAVFDGAIPGLIVREAAGWTSIERDPTDGIARTVVDAATAAAPRLLPDGRILLADGTLFDGTVEPESIDLDVLPEEVLLRGDRVIQDGSDVLRIHDLSTHPPTLILDEVGPRTWAFHAATDDGDRVVELTESPSRLRVRETATGLVQERAIGTTDDLTGIDLAADGSQLVYSLAQGAYHRVIRVDLASGLPGTNTEICPFCGPHALLPDGRVLAGRDVYTVTNGNVTSVQVPGAPNGQSVRRSLDGALDPHGWVWWENGVGLDVNPPFDPAVPTFSSSSWPGELLGDAPGWTFELPWYWRLTGPGAAEQHHFAVVPLQGDRAVQRDPTTGHLAVGAFVPGDFDLTDPEPVHEAPATLLDPAEPTHPRGSRRPCELYRYAVGTWYAGPATWVCVY